MGTSISPTLAQRVKESDLLIVVGARLGEMTTQGYELVGIPAPQQKLVHIHPGAEELGRVYHADIPVNASMPAFARRRQGLRRLPIRAGRHGRTAPMPTIATISSRPSSPAMCRWVK